MLVKKKSKPESKVTTLRPKLDLGLFTVDFGEIQSKAKPQAKPRARSQPYDDTRRDYYGVYRGSGQYEYQPEIEHPQQFSGNSHRFRTSDHSPPAWRQEYSGHPQPATSIPPPIHPRVPYQQNVQPVNIPPSVVPESLGVQGIVPQQYHTHYHAPPTKQHVRRNHHHSRANCRSRSHGRRHSDDHSGSNSSTSRSSDSEASDNSSERRKNRPRRSSHSAARRRKSHSATDDDRGRERIIEETCKTTYVEPPRDRGRTASRLPLNSTHHTSSSRHRLNPHIGNGGSGHHQEPGIVYTEANPPEYGYSRDPIYPTVGPSTYPQRSKTTDSQIRNHNAHHYNSQAPIQGYLVPPSSRGHFEDPGYHSDNLSNHSRGSRTRDQQSRNHSTHYNYGQGPVYVNGAQQSLRRDSEESGYCTEDYSISPPGSTSRHGYHL